MIKSTANGNMKPVEKYPVMRITEEGLIVLFTSLQAGFVVATGHSGYKDKDIGHYSESWDHADFQPWRGTVTLTQD